MTGQPSGDLAALLREGLAAHATTIQPANALAIIRQRITESPRKDKA